MKGNDNGQALFLNRQPYRRRRLRDAAKMLPILGAILFVLPLLWLHPQTGTSSVGIYLFAVWGLLIVLAALLSRRVQMEPEKEDSGDA